MGSLDMRFKVSGAWDNWAVEAQTVGVQAMWIQDAWVCENPELWAPGCRMIGTMDAQGFWDTGCPEL